MAFGSATGSVPIGAAGADDLIALGALALLLVLSLGLWLVPVTISFLKGRNWLGVLGLFVASPFAWWATIRPAMPDSWWARNRYTPEQIAEAEEFHTPKQDGAAGEGPAQPG